MALKDDPKVQELVAKEIEKAVKGKIRELTLAVRAVTAAAIEAAKETGDRATAKLLTGLNKEIVSALKGSPKE